MSDRNLLAEASLSDIRQRLFDLNRQGDLDAVPVTEPDTTNWLQRFRSFVSGGGPWGTAQPGQRGTFVPSRINEQGKAEPAVPGIIQQPAEGLYGLMTAPLSDIVRSGDRDAIRAAAEASFDVAGALPAAGAAIGATAKARPAPRGVDMGAPHTVPDHVYDRQPLPQIGNVNGNAIYKKSNAAGDRVEYIVRAPDGARVSSAVRVGDRIARVATDPAYQRQGYASALYDAIEKDTGRPLRPSGDYLSDGIKELWRKRLGDDEYNRLKNDGLFSNPDDPTTAAAAAALTAQERPKGIKAYHGSPHDFDKFDLSRIGTGEGAQAYGHGLYFAENEGVARSYRDTLAGSKFPDGSAFDDANPAHQAAAYIAGTNSKAEAIAALNDDIAMSKRQNDGAHAQRLMRARGMLERGEPIPELNNGRMYEVRINADPNDFLDWDKPLSQQPERIRKAMTELANGEILPDWNGMEAYRSVGSQMMSNLNLESPELASRIKGAGIPGVKYLDQGSRVAGEGSRNYVVFDDALVEILRKYANAPDPTTAAILALLTQQQGAQPQQ